MIHFRSFLLGACFATAVAGFAAQTENEPPPSVGDKKARAKDPRREQEEFVKRDHYMVRRGNWGRLGQFDRAGNFVPYPFSKWEGSYLTGSGPIKMLETGQPDGSAVYEHRSGALIRGTFHRHAFVPDIGSSILDLKKDFDLEKPDRPIYNLPKAMFTKIKIVKVPRDAEPSPKWELVPFREADKRTPEGNPWFARVIGKSMEIGQLRDNGEFIPEYGIPPLPFVWAEKTKGRPFYYNLPVNWHPGAEKRAETVEVYEFRSGRLIEGTLHKDGNFAPKIGSKVLEQKDYDPTNMNRVYNLPGVWRKVEK